MLTDKKRYVVFIVFLLLLASIQAMSQGPTTITNKQAGICFRVDDVQLTNRWSEFTSIFDKYNYKASLALNLGSMLIYFPSYYADTLRGIQQRGHEIMDHTPYHRTHYLIRITDTSYYSGRAGVDHIYRDTVCLKWDSVRTTTFTGEGLIDINGNTVISRTAGDFSNIDGINFIFAIYVPSLNRVFRVGDIKNRVRTDVDTLTIASFWDERINLGTVSGVQYHKVGMSDVRMSDSAIYLLANRSRQLFSQLNLNYPKTWIQTGGANPQLYREELKRVLEPNFGFTGGAVYPNQSYKTFNEYNPDDNKEFGMQWEDFRDDIWSLQANKTAIADRIARNYVSIGSSHFDRGGALLGGWTSYVGRVDSLLMWCRDNNIPVLTQSEWTEVLYKTEQDPGINIFPKLNVDLDKNNSPDGYYTALAGYTDGTYDTTSGAPESGNRSYRINRTGSIAYINDLGGLEKDSNDFHIWTKGSAGSVITVTFTFPELGQTRAFTFPASTPEWTKYDLSQSTNGSTSLVVPQTASYADVRISCTTYGGSPVSISGMSLKKKSDLATYIISVTQGDHGTITPGTTEITEGGSLSFALTPETGYHVDSIFVDGLYVLDSTISYTFTNVAANHSITAKFSRNTYTINASILGNGTITPAGTVSVSHGDNQIFTVSPNEGSHTDSILVDGIRVDSLSGYTFASVTGPHTITAYLSLNRYTINATAGPNGTLAPSGSVIITHGSDTSFTFQPVAGFHVDSLFVDGAYIADSTSRFTFTNVMSDHTIFVTFARNTYTITASVMGKGTINPSPAVTVSHGDNQTFIVTPDFGYHPDSILVDGMKVDSLISYTFISVSGPHSIIAYLSLNNYTIDAASGPNGIITPDGAISVPHGSDAGFTFTADFGYYIDSVFVDGLHVDSSAHYTFINVVTNHTIFVQFGKYQSIGAISGIVYNDLNNDSAWNNNDPGLAGWRVDLISNGSLVESTLTDNAGYYNFHNLPFGVYTIRENILTGWSQTAPSTGEHTDVTVASTEPVTGINFGNYLRGQHIRIPLTIRDQTGIPTLILNFGSRIGATFGIWGADGSATEIDYGEGERELPPLAPNFIDARFINPVSGSEFFGNGSWNDSREFIDITQADTYKVHITPGPAGYPITVSWNRDIIVKSYAGAVSIDDLHGTVIDMKTNDSIVIANEEIINLLIVAQQPNLTFLFSKGWNLVSLPYESDDSDVSVIFPAASRYAYIFDPKFGYLTHSTLKNGVGYWLKFLTPQDSLFTSGAERLNDTIRVYEGWNMIGSLSQVIPVTQVLTNPVGIIESDFFEFNSGYRSSEYLRPYQGYWIKVTDDGEIILHSNGSQAITVKPGAEENIEHALILDVSDREGYNGILFIDTPKMAGNNTKSGELPPMPPSGVFDLRFGSNRNGEMISNGLANEFPVVVATEQFPVTVNWKNNDHSTNFFLKIDADSILLDGEGTIQIPDSGSQISIIVKPPAENIREYSLDQNYPNPFNPVTMITYRLPARSRVTVKIFDVLGQTVSTLVDGLQDAGIRNIEWDASGIASGFYFYRLEAVNTEDPNSSFMSVKKMMVLK